MNLVTNAWQAMPGQRGHIEIATALIDTTVSIKATGAVLAPGRYLELQVRDNGKGISADIIERIFDPFFTTKAPGEGTGLGLAVVHGVVHRHGGAVLVSSKEKKNDHSSEPTGTSFRVLLPVVAEPAAQPGEPLESAPSGNGERLLLVDDEPALIELATMVLTDLGYQVVACAAPEEALRVLGQVDAHFDLLMTDFAMPGMTGLHLASIVRQSHPDLPILLTSGFIDSITEEESVRLRINEVLAKPWSIQALAQAVHLALRQRPGRAR
jgi:CheY-like chemotaxis protein